MCSILWNSVLPYWKLGLTCQRILQPGQISLNQKVDTALSVQTCISKTSHFLQDSKCSELSKHCNGTAPVSINKSVWRVPRAVLALVVIWLLTSLKRYWKNLGGAIATSHWQNCYESTSVYFKYLSSWFLSFFTWGWWEKRNTLFPLPGKTCLFWAKWTTNLEGVLSLW